MRVLGIDPGLLGGAAIIEFGDRPILISVIDIPTHGEGAKRRVDSAAFYRWIKDNDPDRAFIERGQAMPDQGASSGFVYGRAVGALEACVGCAGVRLEVIEPAVWKRTAGLPGGVAGKEASRQRVIQLYPSWAGFERKKDHQRAEAVLIAKYGSGSF